MDGALGCAITFSVIGLFSPSLVVPGVGVESWLILPGLLAAARLALIGIICGAVMGGVFRFA